MLKKIMVLMVLVISSVSIKAVEIIPEYYVMERLLLELNSSPDYVSKDNRPNLKAIKVDEKVQKLLSTTENPFYIYDSNGEKLAVYKNDYIVSPLTLASVYVLEKNDFENNYTMKKKIEIETSEEGNIVNQ